MKNLRLLILLALIPALGGCTANYWNNRGNDAADIFTFSIGYGFGGAGRVGPLHAGALFYGEYWGLRGGHFGELGSVYVRPNKAGKPNAYGNVPAAFQEFPAVYGEYTFGYYEVFEKGRIPSKNFESGDNPEFRNYGYPLITGANCPWDPDAPTVLPYYTQIDVAGGALPGVRAGFNIGELFDFFLGFTTLDIFDDDEFTSATVTESRFSPFPNKPTSPKVPEIPNPPSESEAITPPVAPEAPKVTADSDRKDVRETYRGVTP